MPDPAAPVNVLVVHCHPDPESLVASARDRVLGALKRIKRERPSTIIGVMGCMAQLHREKIQARARRHE